MKGKGLLEYQIILDLIILIGTIQSWISGRITIVLWGFLFAIVYGISLASYFYKKNWLIWLNNICVILMSLYALTGLVWATFQEPDLIVFLLVIALILIPLNVFVIYKNVEKLKTI